MTTSEYDRTIVFLAEIFPKLATMPASSRRLYHETFRRAVALRHGAIDGDFYDVAIATSVLTDVVKCAFAELIRDESSSAS
jgi:hypothetical protein